MAQCFSVMPVMNVTTKKTENLYYTWKSFRNVYSVIVMLITFAFTILVISWSLTGDIEFDNIGSSFNLTISMTVSVSSFFPYFSAMCILYIEFCCSSIFRITCNQVAVVNATVARDRR